MIKKIKTGTIIIAVPYCFYNKDRYLIGFTESFKLVKEENKINVVELNNIVFTKKNKIKKGGIMDKTTKKKTVKKEDLLIDVGDLLATVKNKIKPELVDKLLDEIRNSLSFRLTDSVETAVNEFLEKEIQPEIKKNLLANKQAILNGVEASMKALGTELGNKIRIKTVENVAKLSNYDMRKIFEAIF